MYTHTDSTIIAHAQSCDIIIDGGLSAAPETVAVALDCLAAQREIPAEFDLQLTEGPLRVLHDGASAKRVALELARRRYLGSEHVALAPVVPEGTDITA